MKKLVFMIGLFFLLINFSAHAQSGIEYKDVQLDGNKLNEANADLSQIEVDFCNKPGEKTINYIVAPWSQQDICLKASNASAQDIEVTIGFVDGTVTNDQRKNKACMQQWEDKNFWQYVTGFETSFTVPANDSVFRQLTKTVHEDNTDFVVFNGDKKLEDPLGGKIKPTSTYPLTKGYVDLEVDNGIIEEDMTQEDKSILAFIKEQNANEGKVREAFGALNDMPNLIKKISDLESSQKSLEERIEQLEADATANNNLIQSYQSQLKTANKTESKLQEEIETLKSDSNTWKNRYEAKCKETVDKYSALELLKLGIYKLLGKK